MKFRATFIAAGAHALINIPSEEIGLHLLDRLRKHYPDVPLSAVNSNIPGMHVNFQEIAFTEAQARKMPEFFFSRNSVRITLMPEALNDYVRLEPFIEFDGDGEDAKVVACGFRRVLDEGTVAHEFSHGLIKISDEQEK